MQHLTDDDFERAARTLGCEVAVVRAVCQVEAPKGGFLDDGRPVILFERHQFSKRTGRSYDGSHPDISNAEPGGYKGGMAEHERLDRAAQLNRTAALESASWGRFQIMGFNHKPAGHPTLQGFINAMYMSEGKQLDAFVSFIKAHPKTVQALRKQDWATFARQYNGPDYLRNRYDTKLAAAYAAFS